MQIAMLLLPVVAFQPGGKLQIKDVKVGRGEPARAGDYVTVDYTGTLMNGTKFDSSRDTGREPFKLVVGVGQVIKGWDQGLQGMKVGGKRVLTIPPDLAYGSRGAGSDIPPNSTLKFEVEMRAIERVKKTVLRPGTGAGAGAGDTISIHYKGSLANGKQFDSSYGKQPFPVTLGQSQVIPGFTMGLLGIKKGEKRRIVIPPTLGYGAQGAGGVIPPNATLTFELEALDVTKR